ncbi:MAG: hypothetical protein J5382_03975 [Bacteroidales bacterium]|nr:hypothetical protein [Bacteroidales bacterium]
MKTIAASGRILQCYQTGDRPVLVLCADGNHYICKFKQPGLPANKLVNELIGSVFAKCWGITTPAIALIGNDPIIWEKMGISHDLSAPLLGSRKMDNVIDLSEINCSQVPVSRSALSQLLRIALFDLWITNEDRTCNNYNLLYDLRQNNIVSIDYGGVFNSGTMERPLYQLNESDSIISSDLFDRLKFSGLEKECSSMYLRFLVTLHKCSSIVPNIIDSIPEEWIINRSLVIDKIKELFNPYWVTATWDNFREITSIK